MLVSRYKDAWDSLATTTAATPIQTTNTANGLDLSTTGVENLDQNNPDSNDATKSTVGDPTSPIDAPSGAQDKDVTKCASDEEDEAEVPPHSSMRRIMDIVQMEGKNGLPIIAKARAFRKPKTNKHKYDDYTGVVRRSLDSRGETIGVTLEVRSPFLRHLLKNVLKEFKDVNLESSCISLPKMYKPLFHKYRDIERITNSTAEGPAKEELTVLFDFMSANLEDTLEAVQRDTSKKRITPSLVWTLFPPGELVYLAPKPNRSAQCLAMHSCTQGISAGTLVVELKCAMVSYNGRSFGESRFNIVQTIDHRSASFPITDLDCYPLKYHPNFDEESKKLVARGKNYVSWVRRHHMSYRGTVRTIDPIDDEVIRVYVNSRVMIDYAAYVRNRPNATVSLEGDLNPDTSDGGMPCYCGMANCPYDLKKKQDEEKLKAAEKTKGKSAAEGCEDMTEDQLLRCPAMVGGFALQEKVWAEFNIDRLAEIEWNKEAYDKLEMDTKVKDAIQALVAGHRQHSTTKDDLPEFDDIIAGKGVGLTFLLQGPPGLGKTLTAESVSEQSRKPLYSVTSGELGTTVHDMETNLRRAFSTAKEWNAILLLDEADVFMGKRSANNLEKNAFVSVFLRLMEYYQGILFLTTNRAKDFDEAFISRIHLIIDYKPLNAERRQKIWQNLASNIKTRDVDSLNDTGFKSLAEKYQINGREIKNMLRTAWSLAKHEGVPLSLQHIELVASISTREYNVSE